MGPFVINLENQSKLRPKMPEIRKNCPWRTLAFLPLLTSLLLTKIGTIYIQLLQEEKIFPMMPRSEWSAQWSLRYFHKNAQKVEWKTWSKLSCHYTWMLHSKNCPSRWRFFRSFLTASKPSRRSITAAKTRDKEENEGRKKIPKLSKFWFLRMPESQCTKMPCWWPDRQAVVLQTHFQPDQR